MTRFRDHKYDTSGYVTLDDGVRRTDNASMTKREQALVEAVRELIAATWGTSEHLRAELKVSCAVAAYDDCMQLIKRIEEMLFMESDITLGNAHE